VINEACHRCAVLKCYVTDACEGCFARPCQTNCPKKAISRVNGKAHIDQSLCIGCQLCLMNCPYGAIMKRKVPCMDNCPVDAISKDSKGHSTIDPEKCIHCGRCTIRCAFGAIVMPSQVVDVFRKIKQGKNVIAMLAPATMVQFGATVGQLRQAVLKLGFKEMVEVALGADNTSLNESAEFLAEVATGKQPLMTT
ncbi:MAG: [FeFe]-hydrogenase, partial [Streblomastix strix]